MTSMLSDRHRASLLMLLWCAAIIAHFDDRYYKPLMTINIWCMVLAVLGLFLARSAYLMLAVVVVQFCSCWAVMPNSADNHWLFSMFISVTVAAGLITQLIRDPQAQPGVKESTIEMIAPVIRMLILCMYLFAVFHKLNSDFLNPQISCAINFYHRTLRAEPWLPLPSAPSDGLKYAIIGGVLVLEFLPFLLLAWRRTWFLGIVAGFVFHMSTGLFMRHFPTILFCLYPWFVPADVFDDLVGRIERLIRKLTKGCIGIVGVIQFQAIVWTAWTLGTIAYEGHNVALHSLKVTSYRVLLRTWNVAALVAFLVFVVLVLRFKTQRRYERTPLRTRAWPLYAIVAMFVLTCMSPYLGLNQHPCMAMWSNLYVKNGHSNHLLIPAGALTVFPYMDDMVEIKATNVPSWRRYVGTGQLIAFSMLQRKVQRRRARGSRKLHVRYVRGGVLYETRRAESDPEFRGEESYFFRKWILIKNGNKRNRGKCEP